MMDIAILFNISATKKTILFGAFVSSWPPTPIYAQTIYSHILLTAPQFLSLLNYVVPVTVLLWLAWSISMWVCYVYSKETAPHLQVKKRRGDRSIPSVSKEAGPSQTSHPWYGSARLPLSVVLRPLSLLLLVYCSSTSHLWIPGWL